MVQPVEEITTAEAARIMGVSDATIVSYADKGLLGCRRLPSGHRRFLRQDVEALRASPPPTEAAS